MEIKLTYAVSKGVDYFDWNEFLSQPCEEMGTISYEILKKSGSWVTCACGSQCDIIPRDEIGKPLDDNLNELGSRFHTEGIHPMYDYMMLNSNSKFVEANHCRLVAIELLKLIESRSTILIEKELNRMKEMLKRYSK